MRIGIRANKNEALQVSEAISHLDNEKKVSEISVSKIRLFGEYIVGKTIESVGGIVSLPALPLLKGYLDRIKISG